MPPFIATDYPSRDDLDRFALVDLDNWTWDDDPKAEEAHLDGIGSPLKVVCLIPMTAVISQGAEKARTGVSVVGIQTEVQTITVDEGMDEAAAKDLDEAEVEDGGSHPEARTMARRLMEAALKETPAPIHLGGQDAGSRLSHSRLQLVSAHLSDVVSNLTPGP
ncbi:hypothetical protein FRC12_011462 [Ceratobasidium sp. 428]|nr:hypothetical protein FRC12_011462 [Ceratobasidium sp. 428]